jgi:hypothetical protein
MSSLEILAWLLSTFFFLLYWLLGGTIFALVALSRAAQLRGLQFSCFFSLFTVIAGIGAGWWGAVQVKEVAPKCLQGVNTALEAARTAVQCAPEPVSQAAALGAGALLVAGGAVFMLSHRRVIR